mmetsp:Transcript_11705/g.10334  ORF Transcript_11705/g.10334 Transcript_11705/m.10334 type:complete len:264 (+) Transcript_11705:31-822(+)
MEEEIIDICGRKHHKLRILCFHGYYNNIDVMKHQLGYYEQIFKNYADFEYINGFHENQDIFDFQLYKLFKNQSFYSWALNDDKTNKPKGFLESLGYVIDFMNRTGPYDGILGFSQGTFLVRTLLKLREFKTEFPHLEHIPEFGIIISGPLRLSIKLSKEYPQDKYKLLTPFQQPVLYMYGEKDIYLEKIKFGVIEEGDFTVIKHSAGHNVPKLVDDQMEIFISFMKKVYFNRFGTEMYSEDVIDNEYKKNYIDLVKIKMTSKL